MPEHKDRKLHFSSHPQGAAAAFIIKRLQDEGFEALIAGGAVRDALIGVVPGDLDVATKAEPDQVEKLFPNTVAVGKAFGVIRVITQGHSIEVATYRLDQNYKDGRRPESVVFTSREEDAKRRDFTINALYYDPIADILYDDVEGLRDLDQKILRAVGDANKRFQEDELRRLRLIRFVAQLGFAIEPDTWKSVQTGVEGLQKISRERITEETTKMWKSPFLEKAFPLWRESEIAAQVDPFWHTFDHQTISNFQWQWSRANLEEAWAHYFSFHWQNEADWEKSLELFKVSKDLQNKLRKAFEIFQSADKFLTASWGEKRLMWSEPLGPWALRAALDLKKKTKDFEKWQSQLEAAGPLPEPLIRGQDLISQVQGPRLGEILKKTYFEQLNQNWATKEQALEWLKKTFTMSL